jgi:hypothetical protein
VENPQRDQGPFEQQPGRPGGPGMQRTPPPSQPQPQPQPTPIPGINLAPGSAPSDIFRPTPPPPSPKQQVPPQAKSQDPPSANREAKSAAAASFVSVESATPVLLDFDPAYLTLSTGQQQSVLVRATSPGGFPGGTLRVRFDPSVAAAVAVRPVLAGGNGVADARVDGSSVVLELPDSADLSGTRAVAELTLRGIAAGRGTLAFEPVEMAGATVTFSTAVVDVR